MRGSRLLLIVLAACGGARYRTELVGHGNGTVSPRVGAGTSDPVAAPGAGGIQLPQGTYELAMRFDVPRAQLVDWRLACPGVDVAGQVGETFEQYRERRLGELRRAAEQDAARRESAANLVVGAITPRARVGNVEARAHVEVHVQPDAVAELPPGDAGAGTLVASARVITAGDGVCALQVSADDPGVRAAFTVTRIRDLEAEQRMRTMAAREVAVRARGQLTAQLVTAGADPEVARAKLAAEAAARDRVRVEAEARVRARAEVRARYEALALHARAEYVMYLEGKCNARPGHRERLAEQERRRVEARLVADAALAQRRDQAALRARADLRAQLIGFGAKARPPRPPPRPENPGAPPFEGAEWIAGSWSWEGDAWAWQDGGWSDPTLFGDAGETAVVGGEVGVGVGVSVGPARTYQPGVRDHRRPREHVRDHRDDAPPVWRDPGRSTPRDDAPRTRDHRDEGRSVWTPRDAGRGATVRDHRKDDEDDDKPRVRDHRR